MSKKNSIYFILSLSAIFCHFSHADLIGDVCSKSQNAAFCEKALRAHPRAPKADLKGLAKISIDVSKTSAKSGVRLVHKLLKQAKDKRSKGIYETCVENYKDAVDELKRCNVFLKKGDYESLNVYASAALTDTDTCDDGFKEGPNLPEEPSELISQSRDLQGLCDVILTIADLLKG